LEVRVRDFEVLAVAGCLLLDAALALLPVWQWLRHGHDPHYTDDDSIFLPSPPVDFSPALAALVLQGRASRRTISAGLMDLASHDLVQFREEPAPVGRRAGLAVTGRHFDEGELPEPEAALFHSVRSVAGPHGYIEAIMLGDLSDAFGTYTKSLDEVAARRGWVTERPGLVIYKWRLLAASELAAGLLLIGWVPWFVGPSAVLQPIDLMATGLGLVGAAAVTFFVSGLMPSRTVEGAMLGAMLSGYRRTLEATIARSQSLEQVVTEKPLPWVSTPSQEIAWAVAFDLDRQIDGLLSQSLEVSETGGWPKGIRDWFSML
jgi:hypothetical protein